MMELESKEISSTMVDFIEHAKRFIKLRKFFDRNSSEYVDYFCSQVPDDKSYAILDIIYGHNNRIRNSMRHFTRIRLRIISESDLDVSYIHLISQDFHEVGEILVDIVSTVSTRCTELSFLNRGERFPCKCNSSEPDAIDDYICHLFDDFEKKLVEICDITNIKDSEAKFLES